MRSRMGEGAKTVGSTTMKEKIKTAEEEWEVRPGGMLVQKAATPSGLVPTIRVKVKHGAIYHEIYISSQASFGELKKQLSVKTGIHALDQKVLYKDKERDSAAFLDAVGVKDKSKLVVVEDPVAQAKRLLEQRKIEKAEKANKSISIISLEVDKLASKVSAVEEIVNKGGRVVENDVVNLIELLMNQLVKLDDIVGDGDVKLKKGMQVKRVQKYVETLDVIKVKNAQPRANAQAKKQEEQPKLQQHYQKNYQHQQYAAQDYYHQPQHQQKQYQQQQPQPVIQLPQQQPVLVANNWEFFDSLFMPSTSTPISTPTSATTTAVSTASSTPTTRLDWELF